MLTNILKDIDPKDIEENEKAIRGVLKGIRNMLLDNPRLRYKGGWED